MLHADSLPSAAGVYVHRGLHVYGAPEHPRWPVASSTTFQAYTLLPETAGGAGSRRMKSL